ncbi:MAG: DUF1573 domain-containing protein [Flammeovirgaceae bacterium]
MMLLLLCAVAIGRGAQVNPKGAAITWEKPTFDFGDINQGEKVQHVFKFENTGNQPLIITNVEVTCGCTTPRGWPRDPIMPGSRAELEVQFSSAGKFGRQNKVVTVVSNASAGNSQITFTANILEKRQPN